MYQYVLPCTVAYDYVLLQSGPRSGFCTCALRSVQGTLVPSDLGQPRLRLHYEDIPNDPVSACATTPPRRPPKPINVTAVWEHTEDISVYYCELLCFRVLLCANVVYCCTGMYDCVTTTNCVLLCAAVYCCVLLRANAYYCAQSRSAPPHNLPPALCACGSWAGLQGAGGRCKESRLQRAGRRRKR